MNGLESDTQEFMDFENQLQNVLNHLYDSRMELIESFYHLLGLSPLSGRQIVQKTIIEQINNLKPSTETPVLSNNRKYYDVLNYRYVLMLSQKEASYKLGITARHLRRFQRQAVHALALQIWLKSRSSGQDVDSKSTHGSQTHFLEKNLIYQELQNLEKNSPGVMSKISESFERIGSLAKIILPSSITLEMDEVDQSMMASIHPSILNQLLLTCLHEIKLHSSTCKIRLRAQSDNDFVNIQFFIEQIDNKVTLNFYPVPEIINLLNGMFSPQEGHETIRIEMLFPSTDLLNVLIIDDNPDIIHFYKRFLSRTRYLTRELSQGAFVFETVEKEHPDIIVLDVMLPDMDGWELLSQLKIQPFSKDIPVIICSVLGQEELALSLGAKAYLAKPVGRAEFIQALDFAANLL